MIKVFTYSISFYIVNITFAFRFSYIIQCVKLQMLTLHDLSLDIQSAHKKKKKITEKRKNETKAQHRNMNKNLSLLLSMGKGMKFSILLYIYISKLELYIVLYE